MSKVYELYHCRYKGEVVYIGQGARGRHNHCTSGCSHVYELNRIHFLEGTDDLEVEVVAEFKSKAESEEAERIEIQRYRPIYNKVGLCSRDRTNKVEKSKKLKRDLLEYKHNVFPEKITDVFMRKYETLVDEFMGHFGYKGILDGDLVIFSEQHYKKMGLPHMRNLTVTIRVGGITSRNDKNPYVVLIKALYSCYKIDLIDYLDVRPKSLERNYYLDNLKGIERNQHES